MKKLLAISVFVLACRGANAQTWEPLGPSEQVQASTNLVLNTSLAIDPDGNLYVAYHDHSPSQKGIVM